MKHKTALAYCNSVRKQLGLPEVAQMEKGVLRHANRCPIARTITKDTGLFAEIDDHVVIEIPNPAVAQRRLVTRRTPRKIMRFMYAFDREKHKDLIE